MPAAVRCFLRVTSSVALGAQFLGLYLPVGHELVRTAFQTTPYHVPSCSNSRKQCPLPPSYWHQQSHCYGPSQSRLDSDPVAASCGRSHLLFVSPSSGCFALLPSPVRSGGQRPLLVLLLHCGAAHLRAALLPRLEGAGTQGRQPQMRASRQAGRQAGVAPLHLPLPLFPRDGCHGSTRPVAPPLLPAMHLPATPPTSLGPRLHLSSSAPHLPSLSHSWQRRNHCLPSTQFCTQHSPVSDSLLPAGGPGPQTYLRPVYEQCCARL